MAKGNPNDATMLNNFVARVWDDKAKDYKPIYVAPDATSSIRGDVYLSDATNSTDNAATGVTAATPAAVKSANDNANNRVSKTETTAQTMASSLNPKATNTQDLGTAALKWRNIYATAFNGNLAGNATTASTLATARSIGIQNGTAAKAAATFNGGADITINLSALDASTLSVGTVPLARLPQGALERLKIVDNQAAMYKLTTADVQLGDTVQLADTKVMYRVVDEANLTNAKGYVEYAAGTATKATNADHATNADVSAKLTTGTVGSNVIPMFLNAGVATASTGAVGSASQPVYLNKGTITAITSIDIAHGGTGATTAAQARTNLGLGSLATINSPLPIANGGTGLTASPSMLTNLAATTADTVLKAAPRPGVTGVLPIANGGTGKATAADAWTALGGGSVGKLNTNGQAGQFLNGTGTWTTLSTTDNKVAQTEKTDNVAYPILLKGGTGNTALTGGAFFDSAVTLNPSTNTIAANISGSAASLTTARTIQLTGNVTGSATFNGTANATIATTIGSGVITSGMIADGTIGNADIANNAINSAKIQDNTITAADLVNGIGLVYVGTTDPGVGSKYNIWITP